MAECNESDALSKNHTRDSVTLTSRKSMVGCKWIYRIKTHFDGSIEHYKARLVVKSFHRSMGLIMRRPLLRLLEYYLFVPSQLLPLPVNGIVFKWMSKMTSLMGI